MAEHEHQHHGHDSQSGQPVHPAGDTSVLHAADGDQEGHAGHDAHAGHSVAMFRDKFWLTLFLTLPALVWGHMMQSVLDYRAPMFPGSWWIPAICGTAVFAYGGWPFLQGAVRELRNRAPGMMTLIALAIVVAFAFSAAVASGYPGMPLWEELASLVTIMLLGHWLEMRAISQAQGALGALARLLPNVATRVVAGAQDLSELTEAVPISAVREGDILLVRPGQGVPADGIVRAGVSDVNESAITGESVPVRKDVGDRVIAGTVNGSGSMRIEVMGTGDRTSLAGIIRLVAQAQATRSRAQALADRAAFWLTWIALGSGALTFLGWMTAGQTVAYAVERVVTVLVIACPHALGLAIPLVVAISTTRGAEAGLLVRDRRGLEEARNVTTVVFDKTGTLTRGEVGMVGLTPSDGLAADDVLRLAAAIESDSEHPIARAIVRAARGRGLALPPVAWFEAYTGRGVRGRIEERDLYVGGPTLLAWLQATLPDALERVVAEAGGRGEGTVFLIERRPHEHAVLATFVVADMIRPESREAIDALHADGVAVVMMTGDAGAVALAVAGDLGIDTVFAGVLPADKAARIQELQRSGERVAMVGDGVNDAPALVTADVGVAMGAGTDVAVEAGDVVLVRSDPRDVARIIRLSRATYRKMVQNLWWAAGYNIVAIPLAAGVLASSGFVLSPTIGAGLMSLSTIVVAVNAQLLRRVEL
ncbi:MAG: Copper-exporting P-type ATPase B [Gemmatimonadaceae bacterium]|nr:Copper-exporting P-type ATPase B [Gemmatimonadaceae bacterium]